MSMPFETREKKTAGPAHTGAPGMDPCCGGSPAPKAHESCLHHGVSDEELMKKLEQEVGPAEASDVRWTSAPLGELTRHIRETHHAYVRQAVQKARPLFERVERYHSDQHPNIVRLDELFSELGQEMLAHMQKEDMILFPYIDALERSRAAGEPMERPFFQTVRNPIYTMLQEHDAADDLMRQIHELSRNYTPPDDGCITYAELCDQLREFEKDMHQHIHLENNILFPRALLLENKSGFGGTAPRY